MNLFRRIRNTPAQIISWTLFSLLSWNSFAATRTVEVREIKDLQSAARAIESYCREGSRYEAKVGYLKWVAYHVEGNQDRYFLFGHISKRIPYSKEFDWEFTLPLEWSGSRWVPDFNNIRPGSRIKDTSVDMPNFRMMPDDVRGAILVNTFPYNFKGLFDKIESYLISADEVTHAPLHVLDRFEEEYIDISSPPPLDFIPGER